MAQDAPSSPFIRNLASSDKKIRDQALKSLRMYLGAQSEIAELDLLKLWKGLFYCLWMQDKPALQQRLSRDLASLALELRQNIILPFVRTFWITMSREWGNIEALRLDKYLYLTRQYVQISFQFLSHNSWKQGLVESWNNIMRETPLDCQDMKIPNGLKYHVLDVWVDELEKVEEQWGSENRSHILETLMEPVEELARNGRLKVLRTAAKDCLADQRLRGWRGQEDVIEKEQVDEDDEVEWGGFGE